MSFKYKTQVKEYEIVVDILCDLCHNSCKVDDDEEVPPQFGVLDIEHGYGSPQDGDHEYSHFCLQCFSKIKEFIKKNGGTINVEDIQEKHDSCEDEDCPCDHSCNEEDEEEGY